MTTENNDWVATVRTIEEARDFVLKVGACGVLHDSKGGYSLWDAIDAPDKLPGESGWGEKMGYVWSWKNELPATYPDQIFYGKRKQGTMLCSMDALKQYYKQSYRPLEELSEVAQRLFGIISQAPVNNKELKQLAYMTGKDQKSAFDKAMLELQLAFQIVRVNSMDVDGDTWTPFEAQYPHFTPD
jgi:hypothetical protein